MWQLQVKESHWPVGGALEAPAPIHPPTSANTASMLFFTVVSVSHIETNTGLFFYLWVSVSDAMHDGIYGHWVE